MIVLDVLSVVTILFVLSGLVLFGIIIWTITTRRDKLYHAKYQRFLEHRRRATEKLRKQENSQGGQIVTTARDFIYVDVERLESLYSQVFEGVVDTIVQTEVDEYQTADAQRGGIRHPGSTLAERVAEASYKTESRILYDHMYNLLEDRLERAIVEAAGLSRQDYAGVLGQAFMVKVQGQAEIADFQRIKTVFDEFNGIAKALDYISTYEKRQVVEAAKAELGDMFKAEKDRNRKAKIKGRMTELEKQLDEQGGAQMDDTFLKSISYITDMFCSDRLEVTIHPTEDSEVIFRGILDKQWLRVPAGFLRALYGGYPAPNLTMVGHLTYVPAPKDASLDIDDELPEDSESDATGLNAEEKPSTMRDAYRVLMTAYQELEKTFTDSEDFVEVIVWPLAIYRETAVPEVKEDLKEEGAA